MKNEEGVKVKCPRCGYEWYTKTKNYYVTCPRCLTKVKVREPPKRVR